MTRPTSLLDFVQRYQWEACVLGDPQAYNTKTTMEQIMADMDLYSEDDVDGAAWNAADHDVQCALAYLAHIAIVCQLRS